MNESTPADGINRLRREVAAIGPLIDETIPLAWSGRHLAMTRPVNMDALLDQIADDPEQNLPYWAEIWPSGIALADAILAEPETVADRRVLELGCGAGTTAAGAVLAGARLTVTDYALDSLTLCRYNTLVNAGREPDGVSWLNWRQPDAGFLAESAGNYDVVLVADGLYETRDIAPLLDLVTHVMAPGGTLWIAEPGREAAARFLMSASDAGWAGPSIDHPGPYPDPADANALVGLHRLRRSDA
ncbi:MAG TPA: methyltransferase [Thermomicrobiales bacterium]|jgi:predicted nicotinamide N-methyase|nr:methyltransferase [Thermomicrobiales bacterium]